MTCNGLLIFNTLILTTYTDNTRYVIVDIHTLNTIGYTSDSIFVKTPNKKDTSQMTSLDLGL